MGGYVALLTPAGQCASLYGLGQWASLYGYGSFQLLAACYIMLLSTSKSVYELYLVPHGFFQRITGPGITNMRAYMVTYSANQYASRRASMRIHAATYNPPQRTVG